MGELAGMSVRLGGVGVVCRGQGLIVGAPNPGAAETGRAQAAGDSAG